MGTICNVEDKKTRTAADGAYYLPRLITAALILAICTAEKPPEVVMQSRPGFAPQKGQIMPRGLAGRTSGIFCL